MKICIIMGGDYRMLDDCIDNITHNVIQENDSILLGYFWNSEYPKCKERFDRIVLSSIPCNDLCIVHGLDLKKYESNKWEETSVFATFSMTYIRKKASMMIESCDADYFIFCRPDMVFADKIPWETIDLANNTIWIPDCHDYREGINDRFAISSKENIITYLQLYNYLDSYYDKGCKFHPETLLKFHLEEHGMKIIRFPLYHELDRYVSKEDNRFHINK